MTQRWKHRDAISNYFDSLTAGIGKRGSSFMDVDAVSHDQPTGRFLFQEFKQPEEPLSAATEMVLSQLATLPRCTVWFVRRIGPNQIGWMEFGATMEEQVISEQEYQARFHEWWHPRPIRDRISADDIRWSVRS